MAKGGTNKASRYKSTNSKSEEKAEESSSSSGRALWRGSINFGLVSIPVRLVTAIRDTKVHFHRVTPDGHCRLRQRLVCPDTGKEYDFSDSALGYEVAPGQYVIVDKEEIKSLEPMSGHTADIVRFVKLKEIDPIYFDRPYYFVPEESATLKPYILLRKVMEQKDCVAVAKMIMHGRQYLMAICPAGSALRAQVLHFQKEVVDAPKVDAGRVDPSKREFVLASDLIDSLTDRFNPSEFVDDYQQKVNELVRKRSKGIPVKAEGRRRASKKDNVADLMERLHQSIKRHRPERRNRKSAA